MRYAPYAIVAAVSGVDSICSCVTPKELQKALWVLISARMLRTVWVAEPICTKVDDFATSSLSSVQSIALEL